MKMSKMIASFLCAGVLASVSALADDAVVPQANGSGAPVEQLKQDKAAVKADRKQLRTDRKKLREDRSKVGHKVRKHKKTEQQQQQAVTDQPKTN